MSFKLFIIPAVVLSLLYGFAMTAVVSADTVTVTASTSTLECELIDDVVECDVSSIFGISNVEVVMNSGIGPVTIFDQAYEGCPTEVHVSLDPMVLKATSEMNVTPCPVVIDCDGCSIEVCWEENPCEDELPEPGVGRPDPLPLTSRPVPFVKPIVLANPYFAPR